MSITSSTSYKKNIYKLGDIHQFIWKCMGSQTKKTGARSCNIVFLIRVVLNCVTFLELSVKINFTGRTCNSFKGSCRKKVSKHFPLLLFSNTIWNICHFHFISGQRYRLLKSRNSFVNQDTKKWLKRGLKR